MNSNLLDLFCLEALTPEEPTTSSSSDDTTDDASAEGTTPDESTHISSGFEFLADILENNERSNNVLRKPTKRKGRSLMETVDLLHRRKESSPTQSIASSDSSPIASTPTPPALSMTSVFPMENNTSAADRLASFVSQEQEREVKNRIKALTNQISAEAIPSVDDDKRFHCHICLKKFANKFLLNKHIFIHTGLRPHQCPDCQKSFNRKDNLLRHRKTHIQTHERPATLAIHPMLLQASQEISAHEATVQKSDVDDFRANLPMLPATPEALLRSLFPALQ